MSHLRDQTEIMSKVSKREKEVKATWPYPTVVSCHMTGDIPNSCIIPNGKNTACRTQSLLFFSTSNPFKDGPGGNVGGTEYVPAPGTRLTMIVPGYSLRAGSCSCQILA